MKKFIVTLFILFFSCNLWGETLQNVLKDDPELWEKMRVATKRVREFRRTIDPTYLRETIDPTLLRETIDPTLLREVIDPTATREAISPIELRESISPVSIREAISPVQLRDFFSRGIETIRMVCEIAEGADFTIPDFFVGTAKSHPTTFRGIDIITVKTGNERFFFFAPNWSSHLGKVPNIKKAYNLIKAKNPKVPVATVLIYLHDNTTNYQILAEAGEYCDWVVLWLQRTISIARHYSWEIEINEVRAMSGNKPVILAGIIVKDANSAEAISFANSRKAEGWKGVIFLER